MNEPRIISTLAALLPADVDDYDASDWELALLLVSYRVNLNERDRRAVAGKDVSWDTDARLWACVLEHWGYRCQHPEEWRKPCVGLKDAFECEACGDLVAGVVARAQRSKMPTQRVTIPKHSSLLGCVQARVGCWPELESPLEQSWVQVAAPGSDWNEPYAPPWKVACACSGTSLSPFGESPSVPVDGPLFESVELKRHPFHDLDPTREIGFWVGQCGSCKKVYWTMLAGPILEAYA